MLDWITQNLSTIIVCAVLVAVVVQIVYKMIRDKKAGKSSCGCNCGSCALSDQCHKKEK